MKKIQLNKQSEHLLPYPEHPGRSDTKLLTGGVGIHEYCGGHIVISGVSETHRVLYCGCCNFRLLIPLEVNTWKKLKVYMCTIIVIKAKVG